MKSTNIYFFLLLIQFVNMNIMIIPTYLELIHSCNISQSNLNMIFFLAKH